MSLAIVSWCQLTMFLFASITFPPKKHILARSWFFFQCGCGETMYGCGEPLARKMGCTYTGHSTFREELSCFSRVCPHCPCMSVVYPGTTENARSSPQPHITKVPAATF